MGDIVTQTITIPTHEVDAVAGPVRNEVEDSADTFAFYKNPGNADDIIPSFAFMAVSRDSEAYNMQHPRRGKALILNHSTFDKCLELNARNGTNKDRDNLYMRLRELDFEVKVMNDASCNEIFNTIVDLAAEDHSNNDCLLVAIMSHGDDGLLYARDKSYKPERLWSEFTSDRCPSLASKPKIFLIQACQGDRLDSGTTLVPHTRTDSAASYKIPTHADFLIAYSTIPGFYSWRNTTNGSWFVQALCAVLQQQGQEDDFLSILTTVARVVAIGFESNVPNNPSMHQMKQIPCVTSLLTRKIYFKRKTSSRLV